MRLDQYLTITLGISRKDAKLILKQKKIQVNDVITNDSSQKIDENLDVIKYNDEILKYQEYIYLLFNKPKGCVTSTSDPKYPTVMNLITHKQKDKLFPVGRLDLDTEGLLLITNDGNLAHDLLSPKKHVPKTYYVECNNSLPNNVEEVLLKGMILDGSLSQAKSVKILDNNKLELTITEGKYHQVKRMINHVGLEVTYLKRICFGNLELPKTLPLGSYVEISLEEIKKMR